MEKQWKYSLIGIVYIITLVAIIIYLNNHFISGREIGFGITNLILLILFFGIPAWILFILSLINLIKNKK